MPSVNGMTTQASAPLAPAPAALRLLRRLAIDSQYVLVGFPLGIIAIVLLMTGFWLGVGLAVIWVGIPVLVATIFMARGFAAVERARIGPVFGRQVPHPYYKKRPDADWLRRMFTPLADGQSWLDLLHGMFRFIPSTIAFSFVVTWWAGTLGGLSWFLWGWSIPNGPDNQDLPDLL